MYIYMDNKDECLENIVKWDSSLKAFKRESKVYGSLKSKVKLAHYKTFGKKV